MVSLRLPFVLAMLGLLVVAATPPGTLAVLGDTEQSLGNRFQASSCDGPEDPDCDDWSVSATTTPGKNHEFKSKEMTK